MKRGLRNRKKKYINIGILVGLVLWCLYAGLHIDAFRFNKSKASTVSLTRQQDAGENYEEYVGEFQAKREYFRRLTFQFNEIAKKQRIQFTLEDENHNTITSQNLYSPETSIKLNWKLDDFISLTSEENYFINIKIYGAEKYGTLESVKIKYLKVQLGDYLAATGIAIMTVLIWILYMINERRKNKMSVTDEERIDKLSLFHILGLGGVAFFSFWFVEYVFQNDILVNFDGKYLLYNWLLYMAVYLILLFLTNSWKASAYIGMFFFFVWGVANQYVYIFRGQALQPVDLKTISTAAEVASEYDYSFSMQMMVGMSAFLLVLVILLISKERKICQEDRKKRMLTVLVGCMGIGALYGFIFQTNCIEDLNMDLDMWDSHSACENYGTVLTFLGYTRAMEVDIPEDYSVENVEKIESNQEISKGTKQQQPNIVVVMDEAFADVSYLGDFETNEEYLANYNSLTENAIKGKALASIFGGGTCNSEFEVLTGHSMSFMPGHVPYVQHVSSAHYSMATTLKAQGYSTIAMHPHTGKNYRRHQVYPLLGFDKFISVDEMDGENAERVRRYISDKDTFDQVLDILKNDEANKPAFVLDVTVQNHSGFAYKGKNYEEKVSVNGYQDYVVNQYLTLIKESDAALGYFVEELKKLDEPTVLLFFGDHFPRLPQDFYNWIMGADAENNTLEMIQKKYSVPYVIWANYELDQTLLESKNTDLTSLNYLGALTLKAANANLTKYDSYRLKLMESIPAMNVNGYIDAVGIHHSWEEKGEWSDLFNEYWTLEYNELIDTKHTVTDFFNMEK